MMPLLRGLAWLTLCVTPFGWPPQAYAAEAIWTRTRICQAAVAAYFYETDIPSALAPLDDEEQILGNTGQLYLCVVGKDAVTLSWAPSKHSLMTSDPITVTSNGDLLVVRSDTSKSLFKLIEGNVKLLDRS